MAKLKLKPIGWVFLAVIWVVAIGVGAGFSIEVIEAAHRLGGKIGLTALVVGVTVGGAAIASAIVIEETRKF